MRARTIFHRSIAGLPRLASLFALWLYCLLLVPAVVLAQTDPLPSWNDGASKKAIIAFVQSTTDKANPNFISPEARVAVFDQDGTTWVEQPMYPQALYCLDRLQGLAKARPELQNAWPFKTIATSDAANILAHFTLQDLMTMLASALPMTVDAFASDVQAWLATARDPHFNRPYTELVYLPMLEVMEYMRVNGYKTYFVSGGGQDFVRVFSEKVYAIPPEQVVGTMVATSFGYDTSGKPVLTNEPRLLLNGDRAGKPQGIHLMIGRRPNAAFGNSDGDKEMLEFTQAGSGARLAVLVHHDDAGREYAYEPQTKVGAFSDALLDQAKRNGWVVVSMKNDWKRVFSWGK